MTARVTTSVQMDVEMRTTADGKTTAGTATTKVSTKTVAAARGMASTAATVN